MNPLITDYDKTRAYNYAKAAASQGYIAAIKAVRESGAYSHRAGSIWDLRDAKDFVDQYFPRLRHAGLPQRPQLEFRDVNPNGTTIGRQATKTDFVDICRALGVTQVNDDFPVGALRSLIRARLQQLKDAGKI